MTNRRQFLGLGLTASALPLATATAFGGSPAAAAVRALPLYKVLYDTRFPASAAFAERAAARGAVVHAIAGDMTEFWYDDLYHRWRRGPAALAGLTAYGALFCLERLAWDQRLRVIWRAEHLTTASCVEHRFQGPASVLALAEHAAGDRAWAAAMADVALQCPPGGQSSRLVEVTVTASSVATPTAESLFSWVIGPVARV